MVCNGCRDRTAAVARAAQPAATVVELTVASKSAALNAGDEHATRFPRVYLDADIELPIGVLRATVRALASPGVLCAAPAPAFELRGRPRLVRAYYDVWQQLPYLTEEMVGTGVYALSEPGRHRFDRFPDLTADDQFVLQQFARARAALPARRALRRAHAHDPEGPGGHPEAGVPRYGRARGLRSPAREGDRGRTAAARAGVVATELVPGGRLRDHLGDRQAPGPLRRSAAPGSGTTRPAKPRRGRGSHEAAVLLT